MTVVTITDERLDEAQLSINTAVNDLTEATIKYRQAQERWIMAQRNLSTAKSSLRRANETFSMLSRYALSNLES